MLRAFDTGVETGLGHKLWWLILTVRISLLLRGNQLAMGFTLFENFAVSRPYANPIFTRMHDASDWRWRGPIYGG